LKNSGKDPLHIAAFTWIIARRAAARTREITDSNSAVSPRAINWINRTEQSKRGSVGDGKSKGIAASERLSRSRQKPANTKTRQVHAKMATTAAMMGDYIGGTLLAFRSGGYQPIPETASEIATSPGFCASAIAAAFRLFFAVTVAVRPNEPSRLTFLASLLGFFESQ
jgi:hypothetical protein